MVYVGPKCLKISLRTYIYKDHNYLSVVDLFPPFSFMTHLPLWTLDMVGKALIKKILIYGNDGLKLFLFETFIMSHEFWVWPALEMDLKLVFKILTSEDTHKGYCITLLMEQSLLTVISTVDISQKQTIILLSSSLFFGVMGVFAKPLFSVPCFAFAIGFSWGE